MGRRKILGTKCWEESKRNDETCLVPLTYLRKVGYIYTRKSKVASSLQTFTHIVRYRQMLSAKLFSKWTSGYFWPLFTSYPRWACYWMCTAHLQMRIKPSHILRQYIQDIQPASLQYRRQVCGEIKEGLLCYVLTIQFTSHPHAHTGIHKHSGWSLHLSIFSSVPLSFHYSLLSWT